MAGGCPGSRPAALAPGPDGRLRFGSDRRDAEARLARRLALRTGGVGAEGPWAPSGYGIERGSVGRRPRANSALGRGRWSARTSGFILGPAGDTWSRARGVPMKTEL